MVVTWTPPPAPPDPAAVYQYQVQVTVGTTTIIRDVTGTTYTIAVFGLFGVYSIQVMSLSQHFPGETSAPVEITVRGKITFSLRYIRT